MCRRLLTTSTPRASCSASIATLATTRVRGRCYTATSCARNAVTHVRRVGRCARPWHALAGSCVGVAARMVALHSLTHPPTHSLTHSPTGETSSPPSLCRYPGSWGFEKLVRAECVSYILILSIYLILSECISQPSLDYGGIQLPWMHAFRGRGGGRSPFLFYHGHL